MLKTGETHGDIPGDGDHIIKADEIQKAQKNPTEIVETQNPMKETSSTGAMECAPEHQG